MQINSVGIYFPKHINNVSSVKEKLGFNGAKFFIPDCLVGNFSFADATVVGPFLAPRTEFVLCVAPSFNIKVR